MGAKDGRVYALWLATTLPSVKDSTGDAAYSKVLLVREHNLEEVVEAINITTKDDGDNSAYTGGRADRDISVSCLFDTTQDTGQDKIADSIALDGHPLWWLLTSDVTSDVEWYGEGVPTGRSISFVDGTPVGLDFGIKVNGSVTEQLVS